MIYRISKKYQSRREINKIKKIQEKYPKMGRNYSIGSYSDESESNSSLARDSSWDTYRRPSGCKDMSRFYHAVIDNLKNNKC